MKKSKLFLTGIPALALVFGLVIAGCGSSPQAAAGEPSATPDLTGVTLYYVRADGSDTNAGTSEDAPFKTLAKAVEAAAKTPVKKITVIGTLNGQTDIADSGPDEILITGKADSPEAEKAFLKPLADPGNRENGIMISGVTNIRLEQITITGYPSNGIVIAESKETTLTVGQGAVITGNGRNAIKKARFGGGILVIGGTLILQGNAAVTGNYATNGGESVLPAASCWYRTMFA
jgi:hypothetical protein